MPKNYYQILGISADATARQIKAAYRRRARELHPDVSGRESEPFLELQQAYEVLADPQRRRRYDAQLAAARRRRSPTPLRRAEPLVRPRPAPEPLRPEPARPPAETFGPFDNLTTPF
jgi:DnaJ-class molecular chaperone with C-terminal Zn finger domain